MDILGTDVKKRLDDLISEHKVIIPEQAKETIDGLDANFQITFDAYNKDFVAIRKDKQYFFLTKSLNHFFMLSEQPISVQEPSIDIELIHDIPDDLAVHSFMTLDFDRRFIFSRDWENCHNSLISLIKLIFRRYSCISITNKNGTTIDIVSIAKSFLFNVSYLSKKNYELVKRNEVIGAGSSSLRKRIPITDVPLLKYSDDLVSYYLAGNSADVEKIKYLSFYNVLEYQFDKLSKDRVSEDLRTIVTDPKFKKADLKCYRQLYVLSVNKSKTSEYDLLLKLIKEIVSKEELTEFFNSNPLYTAASAYKINDTKIDLNGNEDTMYRKIAKRVYGVRNALVHSKESEESRYMPGDEKRYNNEIELVRFLAEKTIIHFGEVMDI